MGNKLYPYMTNEEVKMYLERYGDLGFDDLPDWLQSELLARDLNFTKRKPTDLEKWQTVQDAREHRILHNEKTIADFQAKYKRQQPFNVF